MENRAVCVLILAGFLSMEICINSPCPTGTRAVTWTLYEQARKRTWNEALRICKDRGGHLPVTNTHITTEGLVNISSVWKQHITGSFWLGLYSAVSGEVPSVWEANCCLRPSDVKYWAQGTNEPEPEPDNLDQQRCCRYKMEKGWRTANCNVSRNVVCETDNGNCTFETLHNITITTFPNASKAHVLDVSTCWTLCLELRHNGEECVAAVLEKKTSCKLYVGRRLLEEDEVQTSPCPGSVVMLRRCFHANVSKEQLDGYVGDTDRQDRNPWAANCTTDNNNGSNPQDFLPDGVEQGLVTMATCIPPTTKTAASETTTSSISASTTPSSSTQSASQGSTLTSSPPLSSVISSSESSSPETTATTAAGDVATSRASSADQPRSNRALCNCSCPNGPGSSSQHPVNLTAIAKDRNSVNVTITKDQTSKYRRAKTSSWTGQTSHAIVGMPIIVACVLVICCFVLFDLSSHKCRIHKRRGSRKTKVAPEPKHFV